MGENALMGKRSNRVALALSILSWFPITYALGTVLDRFGIPINVEGPTSKLSWNRDIHSFDERVAGGYTTGAGDYWIVLSLLLSRIVYKLIDRRTPISRKEKRWLVYIGVGYAIWTFSGDWLRTPVDTIEIWFWVTSVEWVDYPLDARIKTYALWKLLHLSIGAGIVGVCRWDFVRTFHSNRPTDG